VTAAVFRAEWRKLTTQLSTRLLTLVCALGPLAYVLVLKTQSGVPTDALLGVWVHTSGFSVVFVLLVFAGSWGFPVLAGVAAGDSFASEYRLGTWKTVLTRSATRGEVFVGKVLAVVLLSEALVALLALSSLASSVFIVGRQPTVGISGNVVASGHAVVLVLLSWLWDMLPVLAFTSLAVLFSVATASGIAGVLGPVLVGFAMQLLALVGGSTWAHFLLVGSAFDGWHAIVSEPRHYDQLVVSAAVCLVWTVACLGAAWLILRRREFAGIVGSRGVDWPRLLRGVVAAIVVLVLAALACTWGPTGVTGARLEDSFTRTFSNLVGYQQELLGQPKPSKGALLAYTTCSRATTDAAKGPGGDWTCSVQVLSPAVALVTPGQVTVPYEVDVQSSGCYRAQAPPAVIGGKNLTTQDGREVLNPLLTIYGCFNTL
jgi:ABC-2 type transport system permease protein